MKFLLSIIVEADSEAEAFEKFQDENINPADILSLSLVSMVRPIRSMRDTMKQRLPKKLKQRHLKVSLKETITLLTKKQ